MALLDDLGTFLAAAGIGLYDRVGVTSTIFYPQMPDAPDSCVALIPYGSEPPGPYLFDSSLPQWETPRVQLISRDADYDTAFARAYSAYKAFAGVSDLAIGTTHYFFVRAIQSPFSLGRDERNLWRVALNVRCQRTID